MAFKYILNGTTIMNHIYICFSQVCELFQNFLDITHLQCFVRGKNKINIKERPIIWKDWWKTARSCNVSALN